MISATPGRARAAGAAAAAITLAAVAVRVVAAQRLPWFDEIFTDWMVEAGPMEILWRLRVDSGPPLHYLLLDAWSAIAGHSPFALRLPSIALALAGASLLWRLAGRCGGSAENDGALAALGALAVWWALPLGLYYAVEARAYMLMMAAACAMLAAVAAIARGSDRRAAAGLAVAVATALYAHNLAVFLLPALAFCVFLPGMDRARRTLLAGGVAVGGLAWLPWTWVLARQPFASVAWMKPPRGLAALTGSASALSPSGPFPWHLRLPTGPLPALTPLWALLVLVLAVAVLAPRGAAAAAAPAQVPAADVPDGGEHRRLAILALVFAIVPLAGLACAFALGLPVYFPGRAETLALPGLCLAAGVALASGAGSAARLRRGLAAALVLAAVVCGAVVAQRQVAKVRRHEPDYVAQLAARLAPELRAGDVIAASGHWWLALRWHLRDRGFPAELRPVPAAVAEHPGWFDPAWHEPALLAADARRVVALAEAARRGGGRFVWVTLPAWRARQVYLRALAPLSPRRIAADPTYEVWIVDP